MCPENSDQGPKRSDRWLALKEDVAANGGLALSREHRTMKLLTKAEVADILRISQRSVDRLRVRRELPSLKVRTGVRFRPEDIAAYIAGQREHVGG